MDICCYEMFLYSEQDNLFYFIPYPSMLAYDLWPMTDPFIMSTVGFDTYMSSMVSQLYLFIFPLFFSSGVSVLAMLRRTCGGQMCMLFYFLSGTWPDVVCCRMVFRSACCAVCVCVLFCACAVTLLCWCVRGPLPRPFPSFGLVGDGTCGCILSVPASGRATFPPLHVAVHSCWVAELTPPPFLTWFEDRFVIFATSVLAPR